VPDDKTGKKTVDHKCRATTSTFCLEDSRSCTRNREFDGGWVFEVGQENRGSMDMLESTLREPLGRNRLTQNPSIHNANVL